MGLCPQPEKWYLSRLADSIGTTPPRLTPEDWYWIEINQTRKLVEGLMIPWQRHGAKFAKTLDPKTLAWLAEQRREATRKYGERIRNSNTPQSDN